MDIIHQIQKYPEVVDNNHESIYRSYAILELVKSMLKRNDSKETILMVISACEEKNG